MLEHLETLGVQFVNVLLRDAQCSVCCLVVLVCLRKHVTHINTMYVGKLTRNRRVFRDVPE